MRALLILLAAFLLMGMSEQTAATFQKLNPTSKWNLVKRVEVDFETFHTQGMVKIEDHLFVSAVEVIIPTETYGETDALNDFSLTRTIGQGRGWVFKLDLDGKLIDKVQVGRGAAYHPGGMDYDGKDIWLPVAQYRPNSESDIYRLNPNTMKAVLAFSVKDHIGAIVRPKTSNKFIGLSWGARRVYTWDVNAGKVSNQTWTPNPVSYIDYQDCQSIGTEKMICGGVGKIKSANIETSIGGLDLHDIGGDTPKLIHKFPIHKFITREGVDDMIISQNPFWVEGGADDKLRLYFMPDHHKKADLLIYDVEVK
ncbi:MAG: DUF6454 family protein [Emcibacteraceae bacterium]|nr:DUF6454 family protein [Emcibacteraceae bacterium]